MEILTCYPVFTKFIDPSSQSQITSEPSSLPPTTLWIKMILMSFVHLSKRCYWDTLTISILFLYNLKFTIINSTRRNVPYHLTIIRRREEILFPILSPDSHYIRNPSTIRFDFNSVSTYIHCHKVAV
jgi:hypothetical protein